jgi:CTP synthase
VLNKLGLEARQKPDWSAWEKMVAEVKKPKPVIKIALVGKYVELHDAYMSVREAVKHASLEIGVETEIAWIHSSDLEKGKGWDIIENVGGIIVPGGFGSRGTEGKMMAAHYARIHKIPYLGLCLGMQLMVVEFARQVLGNDQVNSTEFDRSTNHPVIDLMPDQRDITDMGGTMRLGLYPCQLQPGTQAAKAYARYNEHQIVQERHRHRFEFNNAYRELLAAAGMVYSGISPDGRLVEIAELRDHPFMVGTQFHPELLSRPNRPHPLFVGFLLAVKDRVQAKSQEQEPLGEKTNGRSTQPQAQETIEPV